MYRARFKRWGLGKRQRVSGGGLASRPKKQPRSAAESAVKPPQRPQQDSEEDVDQEYSLQDNRDEFGYVNGYRIDLSQIPDPRVRRYLLHQSQHYPRIPGSRSRSELSSSSRSSSSSSRSPSPIALRLPDNYQAAEQMYRAIREYYSFSFATSRWHFEEDASPTELTTSSQVIRTTFHVHRAFLIWRRFNTALRLFLDPTHPDNRAQSIKIIRICFHELAATILSNYESPLLLFFLMHTILIFRTAAPRNQAFKAIEASLLRHLFELTQSRSRSHPTATLWRTLWNGGRGVLFDSDSPSSSSSSPSRTQLAVYHAHVEQCITSAADQFSVALGARHKRTLELRTLAIFCSRPIFSPYSGESDQLARFEALFEEIQSLPVFDGRDLDVRAWLAAQYLTVGKLEEAAGLMEEVLERDPDKIKVVEAITEAVTCLNVLQGSIRMAQGRMGDAEACLRKATDTGKRVWEETEDEAHYSDGLLALEQCLRTQGKLEEADEMFRAHRRLLKDALALRGESDSV